MRFRRLESLIHTAGPLFGASAQAQQYAFVRLRDFVANQRGMSMGRRLTRGLAKLARLQAELGLLARAHRTPASATLDPGAYLPEGYRARMWESYQQVDRAYVPRRYGGGMSLIWPADDATPAAVEEARWREVVDSVEVLSVPGNQKTCLTRHVGELAAILKRVLNRVGGNAPGPMAPG